VRDFIRWAASSFNHAELYFGHGTDNAWDEAFYLVLGALHLPANTDSAVLDARLTGDEKEQVSGLIDRRIKDRVPTAYLINEAWFAGLAFYIDERVLIPRSPIAEVIENGFSPWLVGDEVSRILDMGTGSGCIGIACAKLFPAANVDLVDISPSALEVAQKNVKRHGLESRVMLYKSDLFSDMPNVIYDLIVTNPPYVESEELIDVPAEYTHEPTLALEAGADGLDSITKILARAGEFLSEYGVLVAEVGKSRPNLEQAYANVPFLWLDLERGGDGVFVLTAAQLQQHKDQFLSA